MGKRMVTMPVEPKGTSIVFDLDSVTEIIKQHGCKDKSTITLEGDKDYRSATYMVLLSSKEVIARLCETEEDEDEGVKKARNDEG